MKEPYLEASGVYKKFRRGERHDSLRDLIPAIVRRVSRGRTDKTSLEEGDFWSIRDVSFRVQPGQTLGIIGPNGAGKSTMLKLLTRILRPTRGEVRARGRIGSLIEIAGGFHPDLTGRENIFLQGAIMGMRGPEIRERFDRIVDFSGVSQFIDTPVKRYSSGMNARLGFAIAAHLEPDILVIDEVLAVGDFGFQTKAFDRVEELARQGMPVVVVSHQLDRIAALCTEAILLKQGEVIVHGSPAECISRYVMAESTAAPDAAEVETPWLIRSAQLAHEGVVRSGERVRLRLEVEATGHEANIDDHSVAFQIRAMHTGKVVFLTDTDRLNVRLPADGHFEVDISFGMYVPGALYSIETMTWSKTRERRAAAGPTLTVEVSEGDSFWGSIQMNAEVSIRKARRVEQTA